MLHKGWWRTDSPLTVAAATTKKGRSFVWILDDLFQGNSHYNRHLYSLLCSHEQLLLFNGNVQDSAGIGILYVAFQMLS